MNLFAKPSFPLLVPELYFIGHFRAFTHRYDVDGSSGWTQVCVPLFSSSRKVDQRLTSTHG